MPENEAARLAALRESKIIDTRRQVLDTRLAAFVAAHCLSQPD